MDKAAAAAAAAAQPASDSAAADVERATEALNGRIASLTVAIGEYQETIKRQEARIKKLEQVRLTNGQVLKLQAMKASARQTAAENTELKQRLSVLTERQEAAEASAAAAAGGSAGGGKSAGGAEADSVVAAALASATERNAELQGAKDALSAKLKQYGKRVYELEKEHTRVRAAVEELGGSVPDGWDLGDAVLDCAERFVGRGRGAGATQTAQQAAVAPPTSAVRYLSPFSQCLVYVGRVPPCACVFWCYVSWSRGGRLCSRAFGFCCSKLAVADGLPHHPYFCPITPLARVKGGRGAGTQRYFFPHVLFFLC